MRIDKHLLDTVKSTIERTFYDSLIKMYKITVDVGSDGGRVVNKPIELFEVNCNIQRVSQELVKERYGLDINASLVLTCSLETKIEHGLKFNVDGKSFEVTEIVPNDINLRVFAKSV